MGILKLSLRSLRTDKTRSFFYFCSFVLTTFFIFSFFNLTLNPATGIQLGKDDNTFITVIAVLVIAVAMFCVFLANDFYVGHKNKELSIILMSGASVYRLGIFLFIQSFLIMVIAIPLGLILGYCAIPFINILFQNTFLNTSSLFHFSNQTLLVTFIILLSEVLWCTILNVGYCYRNSIFSVLHNNTKIESYGFSFKKLNEKLYPFLYLLPIVGIIINDDYGMYLGFSLVGVIAVPGLMKKTIPQFLSKQMHKGNTIQMIANSFVKENLKSMTLLMNLISISSLLLMTLILFHLDDPLVSMVALVSYGGVHIMLCMTMFFKLGMSFVNRVKHYQQLRCLGFVEKDLKKVLRLEMLTFFSIALLIPILYQVSMLIKLLIARTIKISLASMIIGLEIIPLVIVFLMSFFLYRKKVISKKGE